MSKQEKIEVIRKFITDFGNINAGRLQSETELYIKAQGKGKNTYTEYIAFLYYDYVSAAVCRNGEEVAWNDYVYEELSDVIIDEIYDLIIKYEF